MRRAASASVALLATASVVGSAAGAAGTGWHVMPVRRLGKRIGTAQEAAVNRSGTSIVAFTSGRALTVVRRTAHRSKFTVSGRSSARKPRVLGLWSLANGGFLLVYSAGERLLASGIDSAGRFDGSPHVLASGCWTGSMSTLPSVLVDSDASRTVVVWGAGNCLGTSVRVQGAIHDRAGWSSSQVFYSVQSSQSRLFNVQLVGDGQDRFLVSVHDANGNTTAVMWGLPAGSQQWEQVTPPQAADGSALAGQNGATLASPNGTITAAWQDASAALVVSTWNGSTWTTPVKAVAGSHLNGHPVPIYPFFVSDGSRTAIVWADNSKGPAGRIEATIRTGSAGSWSAPLVFPHSRGTGTITVGPNIPLDSFWFTASGALAGAWTGGPVRHPHSALYVGRVSTRAASATALTPKPGDTGPIFLSRAGGLHTIVWVDKKGRAFSAVATGVGVVRGTRPLPACSVPGPAASNPDASSQVVALSPAFGSVGAPGSKCPAVLLW